MKANVLALNDTLTTPLSWTFEDQMLDRERKTIPLTRIEVSAQAEDQHLVLSGGAKKHLRLDRPWTLDFTLFDALQRLSPDKPGPWAFDMFEDFDMLRPNQRLSPCGTVTALLGDKSLRLHGYKQLGRGILPRHYWLDDQRRLLFAIGCHVAYLMA